MGLINSTIKTVKSIAVILLFIVLTYAAGRLVVIPARYASYWIVFWDSPAYWDFGDAEYWIESLQFTIVVWLFIILIAVVINIVSLFFDGVLCCCKNSFARATSSFASGRNAPVSPRRSDVDPISTAPPMPFIYVANNDQLQTRGVPNTPMERFGENVVQEDPATWGV